MVQNNKVERAVATFQDAKDHLFQVIKEEMDRIARAENLDSFHIGMETIEYIRKGEGVDCPGIDKLFSIYCCHLNEDGFVGLWYPDEGWV